MSDTLAINTLKINGVSAVNQANSGHPGIVLGAATMMHTLFAHHLIFDPLNPKWINRDRFVLSAGHGSALLYAQLRLLNLISEEDLRNFRQLGSRTPGHPEYGLTPGVEVSSGPLGQGIAMAVGIAVAEESLRARFPEINHYTYVICGDGDLEEGVAMEAMSFAGKQELSHLIVLHDSNDIQLDTPVNQVFNENLELRMKAIHWDYQLVTENSVEAINQALIQAKKSNRPSFIEIKTIIGDGASKAGSSDVHGAPLGKDIQTVLEKLTWEHDGFHVPEAVNKLYQETIFQRGAKAFTSFESSNELNDFLTKKPIELKLDLTKNTATRVTSGEVIKHLNQTLPNWIGGSADLSGSTKASGGDGVFNPTNRQGRNILFGVREFAMAAIANGIAVHSNFKPFISTFFVFSDYLKPALRLSALMNLPVTCVFTHDSVFVGEDGPTHQPIEHTAMLRSVPNLTLIRPGDEKEVIGAYEFALNHETGPTIICLTRQNIESLSETSSQKVKDGAYYLLKTNSEWTIVASGSEIANALKIGQELNASVVSIPSTNLVKEVFWDTQKAITIEAGTTFGWAQFGKYNIGIDTFGESGEGNAVYEHFNLNHAKLLTKIKSIIKPN